MSTKHKDFYVYLHKRATDGSVFYVGKGTGRRSTEFNKSRSAHWKNIASKNGVVVELYATGLQEWYALELEIQIIAYYGRDNLCNMTDGGDGLKSPSIETRRKIAESVRELMKDESVKRNLSEKAKKQMQNKEFRQMLSIATTNAISGDKNPIKNPVHAAKISKENNSRARAVMCVENGMYFKTINYAENWLKSIGKSKANKSAICNCCRGNYKSAYGFTWKYI